MSYQSVITTDTPVLYVQCTEPTGSTFAATIGSASLTATNITRGAGLVNASTPIFDGSSSHMQTSAAIDLTGTNAASLEMIFYRVNAWVSNDGIVAELTNNVNSFTNGFAIDGNTSSPANTITASLKGDVGYSIAAFARLPVNQWIHLIFVFNKSLAGNEVSMYLNGTLVSVFSRPQNNDNTNNFANAILYFMARSGVMNFCAGKVEQIALYNYALDSTKAAAHYAAMPTTPAVTYTSLTFSTADLSSNYYTGGAGKPAASPFSKLTFVTTSEFIRVTTTNDIFSIAPTNGGIGVAVNGVVLSTLPVITPTALGTTVQVVSVGNPGVSKTIELINSSQIASGLSSPSPIAFGGYLTGVEYDSSFTASIVPPSVGARRGFYGNSITGGYKSGGVTSLGYLTDEPVTAFPDLLRRSPFNWSDVFVEQYGNRRLFDDCSTSGARTSFAAQVFSYNLRQLICLMGTNDYILSGVAAWSAASFGTAYADWLDKYNALAPTVRVCCVTPFVRGSEVANSFGDNLDAYRSAIFAVGSTRPWITVIDGKKILTLADLSPDQLHPSLSGQLKLATALNTLVPSVSTMTGISSISGVSSIAL